MHKVYNYYPCGQHDTIEAQGSLPSLAIWEFGIDPHESVKARMLAKLKNNSKQSAHTFQRNFLSAVLFVGPIGLSSNHVNIVELWALCLNTLP